MRLYIADRMPVEGTFLSQYFPWQFISKSNTKGMCDKGLKKGLGTNGKIFVHGSVRGVRGIDPVSDHVICFAREKKNNNINFFWHFIVVVVVVVFFCCCSSYPGAVFSKSYYTRIIGSLGSACAFIYICPTLVMISRPRFWPWGETLADRVHNSGRQKWLETVSVLRSLCFFYNVNPCLKLSRLDCISLYFVWLLTVSWSTHKKISSFKYFRSGRC